LDHRATRIRSRELRRFLALLAGHCIGDGSVSDGGVARRKAVPAGRYHGQDATRSPLVIHPLCDEGLQ
jgi:hypothetical protein